MKRTYKILALITMILTLCSFDMQKLENRLEDAYEAEDAEEYQKAIAIYKEVLEAMPADSVTWISDICSSLLNCHLRVGQLQLALSYGERGLQLDEQMNDQERIASSLGNLASLMITANRLTEAEGYLLRAVDIERGRGADATLAIRLGMLAELYTKMKQPEKALPLASEALQLDQKGGREAKAAIRMSQLGNVLDCLKRSAEALPYLEEALQLHRKHANRTSEAITLVTLGMAEIHLHQVEKAKQHFLQSIELSEKSGLVQPLMSAHMELARQYDREHDTKAYSHLLRYNELHDSLSSVQVQRQISDLEVKYETRQKEEELQRKELLIRHQRMGYVALTVMLLLALLAVGFLVKLVRLKNQNMKLKDRFMQIISHDLKNPAIAQQKTLHLMAKNTEVLPTEEMKLMLEQLAQDADAHVDMLYSLLDWARLQTGHLHYTPSLHSLTQIVDDVTAQLRAQASIKHIEIKCLQDAADHTLYGDRQMVQSMVRNVLSNAIKFSEQHGEIRIHVDGTTLRIDDDGIGLGTASDEKGTGLGLNLVRRFAELNKADFAISKKTGRGTLVTITFSKK